MNRWTGCRTACCRIGDRFESGLHTASVIEKTQKMVSTAAMSGAQIVREGEL